MLYIKQFAVALHFALKFVTVKLKAFSMDTLNKRKLLETRLEAEAEDYKTVSRPLD